MDYILYTGIRLDCYFSDHHTHCVEIRVCCLLAIERLLVCALDLPKASPGILSCTGCATTQAGFPVAVHPVKEKPRLPSIHHPEYRQLSEPTCELGHDA
jgi:hypothetical protein